MLKMSRHILVTICVLAASTFALKAQDYQSSIRKWDEGPLTLQDFLVRDMWTINDNESCLLTYGIRWNVEKRDTATSCTTETPRKPTWTM